MNENSQEIRRQKLTSVPTDRHVFMGIEFGPVQLDWSAGRHVAFRETRNIALGTKTVIVLGHTSGAGIPLSDGRNAILVQRLVPKEQEPILQDFNARYFGTAIGVYAAR